MAETPQRQLRTEFRVFLFISLGAFAVGLAIGFAALGRV